jgi:hypothetical protein
VADSVAPTGTIGEIGEGSRKANGVTAGRSGLWQQDIEQDAIPAMSWPQFFGELGAAGALERWFSASGQ